MTGASWLVPPKPVNASHNYALSGSEWERRGSRWRRSHATGRQNNSCAMRVSSCRRRPRSSASPRRSHLRFDVQEKRGHDRRTRGHHAREVRRSRGSLAQGASRSREDTPALCQVRNARRGRAGGAGTQREPRRVRWHGGKEPVRCGARRSPTEPSAAPGPWVAPRHSTGNRAQPVGSHGLMALLRSPSGGPPADVNQVPASLPIARSLAPPQHRLAQPRRSSQAASGAPSRAVLRRRPPGRWVPGRRPVPAPKAASAVAACEAPGRRRGDDAVRARRAGQPDAGDRGGAPGRVPLAEMLSA